MYINRLDRYLRITKWPIKCGFAYSAYSIIFSAFKRDRFFEKNIRNNELKNKDMF